MSAPPLPRIEDFDLMLEVHTHKHLRMNSQPNPDYGDTDRLAELGSKLLESAVTYHLFIKRPFLSREEMEIHRKELTSPQKLDEWLGAYNLKEKLRVPPNEHTEIFGSVHEMAAYFHTYLAAVFIKSGLQEVQTWISGLIDPDVAPVALPGGTPAQSQPQYGQYVPPAQSYNPNPQYQPAYGNTQTFAPQGQYATPAPPPGAPPPPLPSSPPPMNSMPTSTMGHRPMSLVTLALVNQTAAQNRVHVSYDAYQEGPPHQPTWTVKCSMNGVEKGVGQGKSQKAAKEDAARQAWAAMGWGPT